ncbi:MAG: zinc-ribbon domain-containing protein [Clostridia bacterium]|nr:zinc-ribbon domain-containing protein [Clostridia bacterium]
MVCPKCGAQVEDNATVCPSCNEALQPAAPAAEEKKAEAKKIDLKNIDFKSPKTWLVLAGAVVALVIVIAIICGIVNALSTPDRIAESYAEAYLDGDLKAVLKKSAPWVVRDVAVDLELKENASAAKVAKEFEEYDEFEKAEGKVEVVRSEVLVWVDNEYDNASSAVFNQASGMKFKEAKNIQEYARVKVYYTLTQKGEEPDEYDQTIHLAKVSGKWYVINELD